MKLVLHSITDLITNSSTTIYTYSADSIVACEEMIDEVFLSLGIDKKCKDVFIITSLASEDEYENYLGINEIKIKGKLKNIIKNVISGKIEKPQWMIDAEQYENGSGFTPNTELHIVAKDPTFKKLAEKIVKFLYSTEQESGYDC
jgi:hypothetical protein